MREILFRGKRADNGEWIYGYVTTQFRKYSEGILLTRIQSNTFGVGEHLVDTETVGQYTGLKDKNGRKIFEGDIIKCRNYHGAVEGNVGFYNGIYYLACSNGFSDEFLYHCSDFEVIGNIHDNPELLKGV